jgi:hypothetical protein
VRGFHPNLTAYRLGGGDDADNFIVETVVDAATMIKARPSEGGQVKIRVLDPDGVSLGTATSPNPGAIAKLEVKPSTKKVEVIIENFTSQSLDVAYGLVTGGPDVESPAQPEVPSAPVVNVEGKS